MKTQVKLLGFVTVSDSYNAIGLLLYPNLYSFDSHFYFDKNTLDREPSYRFAFLVFLPCNLSIIFYFYLLFFHLFIITFSLKIAVIGVF